VKSPLDVFRQGVPVATVPQQNRRHFPSHPVDARLSWDRAHGVPDGNGVIYDDPIQLLHGNLESRASRTGHGRQLRIRSGIYERHLTADCE
jgi:hypothetical protein